MVREHWSKIVIVTLLVIVVGVPFVVRPASSSTDDAPEAGGETLIIYTPHNEQIRYEFAHGFNEWRRSQGLAPVVFDWRASGGTSDLRRQVLSQFDQVARNGLEDEGVGADLFFGGGEYEHNQLARGPQIDLRWSRNEAGHVTVGRQLSPLSQFSLRIDLKAAEGHSVNEVLEVSETSSNTEDKPSPLVFEIKAGDDGKVHVTRQPSSGSEENSRLGAVKITPPSEKKPREATILVTVKNPSTHNTRPCELQVVRQSNPEDAADSSGLEIQIKPSYQVSASVPTEIEPAVLTAALPSPTIGGELTYHPDLFWVGTALSSFGIIYNRDIVEMLGLPEPATWRDLTDPRYLRWVALADPGKSGSIAATYNTILRREGWQGGWRLLRRIFANTRYFTSSASKVPVDVSAGEAAAGMCIDFYGRFQAGAIGGDRVGYVDPQAMTATTADPISLLRGAPRRELAEQFIAWTLSDQAQQLWQKRLHTPGGPIRFELRRQPIRPDVYTPANRETWADPQIEPYAEARPFPDGMPSFFSLVAPVSHAMAIDVHDDLVAAWEAIIRTPDDHPDKAEMIALFDAMPEDLVVPWPDEDLAANWAAYLADAEHPRHGEAAGALKKFVGGFRQRYKEDPDLKIADRLRWTLFFRDHYRRVARMGG